MKAINYNQSLESDDINLSKKQLEVAKQTLKDHKFRWLSLLFISIFGGFGGISAVILLENKQTITWNDVLVLFIISAFFSDLMYIFVFYSHRTKLFRNIKEIEYKLIESGSEELKETINEDFFTKLVQINFKYIDKYYFQTQEQADKSFRLSAIAAIAGFIIIVLGIAMMYKGTTTPAYVTTGAGLISEFIAAVFFYL